MAVSAYVRHDHRNASCIEKRWEERSIANADEFGGQACIVGDRPLQARERDRTACWRICVAKHRTNFIVFESCCAVDTGALVNVRIEEAACHNDDQHRRPAQLFRRKHHQKLLNRVARK